MSNNILRLKRIQGRDFMCHETLDLDLDAGLTVIRGPIGSGKSSALIAVKFAFYGLTAVDGGKDIAVRTGAKDCGVELTFTLGNRTFRIERSTKNATLWEGEIKVANGTSAVSDWVKDNLGLDQKMFSNLLYSEQGETQVLLTLGAPALNALVEKISGADFIDRIIRRAATRSTHVDGQLSAIPVPQDTGEMRVELESGQQSLDSLQAEYSRHERDLGVRQSAAESAKKALDAGEHNNRAASRYADGVRRLQSDLASESGRRSSAISVMDRIDVRESLTAEETALSAAQKRLSDCDRQVRSRSEADVALATARRTLERLEPKSAGSAAAGKLKCERQVERDEVAKELTLRERDLQTDEASLKRVTKSLSDAVCQACKRPLDTSHAAELEAEKTALEAVLPSKRAEVNGLQQRAGAISREISSLDLSILSEAEESLLSDAISSTRTANDILSGIPSDIQQQYDAARKAEIAAREALSAARSAMDERARAARQVEESDRLIAKIQADIDSLDKTEPVNLQPLIEALNSSNAEVAEAQRLLSQTENEYNKLEARLAVLEKSIKTNEDYRERRAALEGQSKLLDRLVKFLRSNKSRYLTDTWAALTAEMSEFVSRCTDRDIELIQRTPEGKFQYTQAGQIRPLEGLSGGQRSLAGLGMRIALGGLSPAAAGLLMLDEPSGDLNDEVAAVLAATLRSQPRQVVLVTHRTGEEFVSDRVFVFEK